jgi:hypothetical protein
VAALPFAYDLLRGIGGLDGEPPTLRQAQARGQLTVTELVDRYAVACRPVRDVLVHYLAERSAVLDYRSLDNQAHMLVSLFWADLERHHPGIDTLHLGGDVAHGWKQRVRTLPDGTPRRTFHAVLLSVRSFYLDLLQWSLEDPARWAAWAAPCPVSETDVRGYIKRPGAGAPGWPSAPGRWPRCCPGWSPLPGPSPSARPPQVPWSPPGFTRGPGTRSTAAGFWSALASRSHYLPGRFR